MVGAGRMYRGFGLSLLCLLWVFIPAPVIPGDFFCIFDQRLPCRINLSRSEMPLQILYIPFFVWASCMSIFMKAFLKNKQDFLFFMGIGFSFFLILSSLFWRRSTRSLKTWPVFPERKKKTTAKDSLGSSALTRLLGALPARPPHWVLEGSGGQPG